MLTLHNKAPRDLPRPWGFSFVSRKEINTALADPTMGGSALSGSPADFEKLIIDETEKWAKVVKFAGIKAV